MCVYAYIKQQHCTALHWTRLQAADWRSSGQINSNALELRRERESCAADFPQRKQSTRTLEFAPLFLRASQLVKRPQARAGRANLHLRRQFRSEVVRALASLFVFCLFSSLARPLAGRPASKWANERLQPYRRARVAHVRRSISLALGARRGQTGLRSAGRSLLLIGLFGPQISWPPRRAIC